ncbi:hypothetical protein NLU13_3094 [Sarocladium strictum]|uniref:Velvet domain-containing protein n=1 Tax=Sarocladium strictum TaxID=5046 RepID=A0AA39GM70_SARSR|nr:hypothetical protein NLU13_3094 [Sarocladium strictum]
MSARYSGPPVQPRSPHGPPLRHEVSGPGIPTGNTLSSAQLPRLPSLSSWADSDSQSPNLASNHHSRDVRTEFELSRHRYPQQAIQPHYPQANAESFTTRPDSTVTNLGPPNSEVRQPEMCFRGGMYAEPGYREPRPRPAAGTVSRASIAPPSYREYPSRPPSYDATGLDTKERPVPSKPRLEMHYKRQASSPDRQELSSKRIREQSPPSFRPRTQIRDVVPNLIGPDKAHLVRNLKFSLKIRQQPQQARSCGFADKDRRAIDPPPIVELKIEGEGFSKKDLEVYMNYDRYVMCCTLLDEKGVDAMNMEQDGLRSKRMMGENTVVPFVGTDEHGQVGCFFSFNDLSCRTPGDYRLSFSVSALPTLEESRAGVRYPRMTDIMSDVFKAYNAKLFPGMTESSALARALKEQGCNISVRKGNEKTKNSRGRNAARDDEDEEDDY